MATNSVWCVPWQSTSRNSKSFVHTRNSVDPTSNTSKSSKLSTPCLEHHPSQQLRSVLLFYPLIYFSVGASYKKTVFSPAMVWVWLRGTKSTSVRHQKIFVLQYQSLCSLPCFCKYLSCRVREEKRHMKKILPVIQVSITACS